MAERTPRGFLLLGRRIFPRIFSPDFFSSFLWEKVPRKILQENPRQNPPKIIRQKSPTHFCRGAGPTFLSVNSHNDFPPFFKNPVVRTLSDLLKSLTSAVLRTLIQVWSAFNARATLRQEHTNVSKTACGGLCTAQKRCAPYLQGVLHGIAFCTSKH